MALVANEHAQRETATPQQDKRRILGRITGISIPCTQGLTFGYNANDDITGITDSISASNTQTLGYDSLNRLTSATSGTGGYGSQSYTYDADGNRTQTILAGVTTTYTPDVADNRLASLSGGSSANYSYDSNGNTLADAAHTYQFDDTNRFTTVDSGATGTYSYNGLGQRVSKTTASSTSLFVYDESGRLLGEYDGSGGLIQEHIWLGDRPVGVISTTGLNYVHTDRLDSPRRITDGAHSVVWNWTSDPFGNNSPTGGITYNLRFSGQYFDTEAGHTYNYMRDYDPTTGRYTESDPIGLAGGINTYTYADENPIAYDDSTGQFVWIPVVVAAGGAAVGGFNEYLKASRCGAHGWNLAAATARGALAGAGAALTGLISGVVSGDNPYVAGGAASGSYDIYNSWLGGQSVGVGQVAADTAVGAVGGRLAQGLAPVVRGGTNFNPLTSSRTWGPKATQLYSQEAIGHTLDLTKDKISGDNCGCQ